SCQQRSSSSPCSSQHGLTTVISLLKNRNASSPKFSVDWRSPQRAALLISRLVSENDEQVVHLVKRRDAVDDNQYRSNQILRKNSCPEILTIEVNHINWSEKSETLRKDTSLDTFAIFAMKLLTYKETINGIVY
ncbi:hypothetical protein AVEN_120677-1, partial [Araneus ventricosus]